MGYEIVWNISENMKLYMVYYDGKNTVGWTTMFEDRGCMSSDKLAQYFTSAHVVGKNITVTEEMIRMDMGNLDE